MRKNCFIVLLIGALLLLSGCGHEHTPGEWETVTDATCAAVGSRHKICTDCGEELETEILQKLEHTEGAWTTEKNPSCTVDGEQVKSCTACRIEIARRPVAALGHAEHWQIVVEPTCVKDGSRVKKCSVCNTEFSDEKMPALGHTDNWQTVTEATCLHEGSQINRCAVCSLELGTRLLSMTDHKAGEWTEKIPATCVEYGTKVRSCTDCGKQLEEDSTPRLGHDWQNTVIAPTKTEQGYTVVTCSRGDSSYVKDYVPAIGSSGFLYSINRNATCSIVSLGSCTDTHVVFPHMIDGYTVTKIEEGWLRYDSEITEITVPFNVTSVPYDLFEKCPKLQTVYYNSTFGKSTDRFFDSAEMKKVVFGGAYVPNYILKDCYAVEEVVLQERVHKINNYAFEGCRNLKSITIEGDLTFIGYSAFKNCSALTEIILPDSLEEIDRFAFYNCNNLKEICIPEGVKEIDEKTFVYCTGLTKVVLPQSLTKIRDGAFMGCESLTEIVIPDGVLTMGENAFAGCTGLKTISVPSGLDITAAGLAEGVEVIRR